MSYRIYVTDILNTFVDSKTRYADVINGTHFVEEKRSAEEIKDNIKRKLKAIGDQ